MIKKFLNKIKKLVIPIIIGGTAFAAASSIVPTETIVIYQEATPSVFIATTTNYIAPYRNFDKIQFEELRKKIDWKYNQAHDALSQAYYEGKPFIWQGKDWGILDKNTFEKLQSLLWTKYEIMFYTKNLKQTKPYSESEFNEIRDRDGILIGRKSDMALDRILQLKAEGFEIEL